MMPADPTRPAADPSCEDPPSGELTVAEALARIHARISPIADSELLPLHAASGRILAAAVRSPLAVPGHTNSAVDGFALRSDDLHGMPGSLQLIGRTLAGHPFAGTIGAGQCVAITTGAILPAGADAVAMLEYCHEQDGRVEIQRPCRSGDNVRHAGEDIAEGSEVAAAGSRLNSALLGVLASLGLAQVEVRRRPRIAILSTGDEIHPLGSALPAGGVYDSNRYSLHGLLADLGAEILDLGLVADDPQRLRDCLQRASGCDAILSSGGVSVGEADYIKPILRELGQVEFWKLAIKPGRPLTFGQLGRSLFFGLPGNPVAVMVTFLQFVRPALQRLMGMHPAPAMLFTAICDVAVRKRSGRREYQRGVVRREEDGTLHVSLTGRQGSGILTSMSRANCLIILPEQQADVHAGDPVQIELLPWVLQH